MLNRTHRLVLYIACVIGVSASSALAQTVLYYRFTPMVVSSTATQPVLLEVRVNGLPSRVTLTSDFEATKVIATLVDNGTNGDQRAGDGIYSANLPAATVVQDLQPSDVFRKLLGFVAIYQGTTLLARYNTFVQISTPEIPRVTIRQLAPDAQASDYIVNLVLPNYFNNNTTSNDYVAATRRFYAFFRDDYDQLYLVANQSYIDNRFHSNVKNEVQGIGLQQFNRSADYGSAGRLQGLNVFNNAVFLDGAETGYQHEFGHQWIQFMQQPPFAIGVPHWPYSSMASGIMGFSIGGQGGQGGHYRCRITPEGNNVRLARDTEPEVFKDLDLYLMGLLPADQVGEHFVFNNQNDAAVQQCTNGLYTGPITRVTAATLTTALGQRLPSAATAPKQFRLANIVISANGLLSEEAMAFYDFFARRAEATQELTTHIGLVTERNKPFALSTGGRGTLITNLQGVVQPTPTPAPTPIPLAAVTATSYVATQLASESIAAAFGANLTTQTVSAATLPLPTTLADLSLRITDTATVVRPAPLFFVSPQQINFLVPAGTSVGNATLTLVNNNNQVLATGTTTVRAVAPGLFTANANGQGVPAAVLLRIRADGSLSYEPISQFDAAAGRFVPTPINLGPASDQVFLLLFGSGIRGVSNLSAVTCNIGGQDAPVLYANKQGDLAGLDQVNIALPRNLAGRGTVNLSLTVAGLATNVVQVNFQ